MASQEGRDVDLEDTENSKIFYAVADVFQKAQSSYAGHRKHVAVLKKIQSKAVAQGYEDAFNFWFNKLVTKILPLKKNEVAGDRIVRIVAAFIASLDRDIEEATKENSETVIHQQQVFAKFVDLFMRHILRGVESKERNVRYRVLQLLAVIMDNIGEIDEELYNLLMWSLNKRIYDKEPNVRMQAVFCLTKFQEEDIPSVETEHPVIDDATHKLMTIIQNDSSAEVRRAALLNLVNNPLTRSHILERARDTNQVNRRLVYTRILKSMGKEVFEKIDSRILDQLIKWGLEDREESVRKACLRLISYDWLNMLNGDLIELIEKLNVAKSTIADKAMESLFNTRTDIISKIKFTPEMWKELTVEIAFLLRCFYKHCISNNLTEVLEENFPEASKLSSILNYYIKKRFHAENLSNLEKSHLDFIVEQILIISKGYDFSDEIGRRSMLTIIRNMLGITSLTEPSIKSGLDVLKILSINERDFVSMSIEIINDIRDDDLEKQEQEQISKKKAERSLDDNNEDDDDDEEDDIIEQFRSSVDNFIEGKTSTTDDTSTRALSNERDLLPETMINCLTRSSLLLELVVKPLDQNVLITSLIDTLITPAVRNTDPKIRELGVRNLGLCCLLDVQLATENLYILGMCVSKGNASLKSIALKSIIDIFSIHGNVVVDGEGKVDSISLHKIFYKVLKNNTLPECQVIAAEGLCKLYLADIFNDDDLFETLILSYFSPSNSSNEGLIQAFAFCIPVYSYSHVLHQQRITKIASDVLLRLYMLWVDFQANEETDENIETMLKPNVILQQLISWTDPRKLIGENEKAINDNYQLNFLLDIFQQFPKFDKKNIKKMILTNINAFYVSSDNDMHKLREIKEHLEDIIENEIIDTMTLNSLEKFKNTIIDCLEEAKEKSENQTKDEIESSDGEYSMILESSNIGNISDVEKDVNVEAAQFSDSENDFEDSDDDTSRKRNRSKLEESIANNTSEKLSVNEDYDSEDTNEPKNDAKDINEPEDGTKDVIMEDSVSSNVIENSKNVSFILPDNDYSSSESSMSVDDESYKEE
ncbi:hypothetical protein Kpol_1055p3 [Vanderwaltozyma polyspora DSM 70294]|uniref:Nuclear condensin complex subunit 3 C-terminal domain-containing protein n=1 Tax=Vanderwaltozyma polyspora (strain ATCC 22028 / DSM 70294 / BCRC 21397 / CBS 2163 / NBRC 10782 / NRRL Y-8283 / UCD 57-17) TaxID=436907 RepID=A7TG77_VANPO|nr:uncharacterized protein Kpol_1055p3 [Vanderwaltozyma polyspora DSM 70294]EDO18647.1 hypothetical protein Kpol_1055p3 [Vanderwaltozyma polyspora DSM 70294]